MTYQHSPIQSDESEGGIVTTCETHPWWTSFRFYREDAQRSACVHEALEHKGDYRHRDVYRKQHGVSFPEL